MSGQNRTSIDMYSSQLTAIDGKINIQAGGDLNFLTADDVSLNTTDISKKSSFLGVKLNKSHTTNTRNVKSELPAELNADYIGTKSGFDTRLKGTVFNYLEGAEIQAGGTITLESASTTVTETLKKRVIVLFGNQCRIKALSLKLLSYRVLMVQFYLLL